jgi:hypothetical protein
MSRVLLVVEQTAGPFGAIPDLDLRRAAKIDARVPLRSNLPVHEQFEVAVVLDGLQALSLAVVVQDAVADRPMRQVRVVCVLLRLLQFVRRELRALRQFHKALPAGQVLPVEQRDEPWRRRALLPRDRGFMEDERYGKDQQCCCVFHARRHPTRSIKTCTAS